MGKIAMFLDTAFPPDSRVENEAISLIKAGHEVHLFSLDYIGRKPREVINGIQVHRYKMSKLTYKLSALAYTFPFFHIHIKAAIKTFIDEVRPDALHVHDMVIAKAVMDVNAGVRKLVLDLHENRPVIMQQYRHVKSGLGKWLISPKKWAKVQDNLIREADQLILVTKEAKQLVVEQGLKPDSEITVVPNTILKEVFLSYAINDSIVNRYKDSFGVTYLGDTGLRRGTDTLLKAAAIVKDEIPNLKVVLVGDSSEDEQLVKLIELLNLETFVDMEGWQDVSLFPSYIKASAICVSPIKRNLHHDTTFANKIFQYMSMGKPLIVSDTPTQVNVINEEQCGLIFEAENDHQLAEKIVNLYNDKQLLVSLGENGRQAVQQRWNWDITSKDLVAMYAKILS